MVQKLLSSVIVRFILRFSLVCVIVYIAAQISPLFQDLNSHLFHYKTPIGFFDMASWADSILALCLGLNLLGGIILGVIGKKTDYVIISGIFLFGLWNYTGTGNVTLDMYLGLIGTLVLGNVIGFGLKLARRKFFKDSWIGR